MSVALCVVFERDVPSHGTLGGDNLALMRDWRRLAKAARSAKLRPLADFESYDPEDVAGAMDMDVDELGLDPENLSPGEWFDAKDGLAAVRALTGHLRANPKALSRQAAIVEDLASVESELAAAERAGVRFRFQTVT